ncbi:MAG: hypothetical protein NTZ44_02400 [Candidatus Nomurabacteria bacterium]|nr:hypothetical protein [Candidatus Nomurabacteria bacterium]
MKKIINQIKKKCGTAGLFFSTLMGVVPILVLVSMEIYREYRGAEFAPKYYVLPVIAGVGYFILSLLLSAFLNFLIPGKKQPVI